ncbi:hypothetical protein [uncultured Kordia sp.]|uniref:SecDF P1 head subdomain-containing protein n=1 Tax=uncultured Kordia sp. TaxID=507699 RepID=UPI002614D923|nr:hypothetical protein [uncultured Kordia sp.]
MIQLEIEATDLTENEKDEAVQNIQNRLLSLGAKNVSVVSEKEELLTLSYRGHFASEVLEACFSTKGNLEFYEVCTSKELIMDYFKEKYPATDEENLTTDETLGNKDVLEFLKNINIEKTLFGGVIGYVSKENIANLKATSIFKTPIFISSIKRRVKFLLGKDENGVSGLYPVFLTSENEPHLDGSYMKNASYSQSQYSDDQYMIDLQMNEEGAVIWERLTEKVYQERGYIAIVIDDIVYSAPRVSAGAIKGGRTQISGGFTKAEAAILASVIQTRTIPKVKIVKIMEL